VYNQGTIAYRQEVRSIGADWKRFKLALATAAAEGVTEIQVIDESRRAYSGRLEWISKDYLREKHGLNTDYAPRWEYTPGQYFPTEYRKAAASVLEAAIRAARQARPPQVRKVESIAALKRLNEANGGCWFDAGSMEFFGTRIESDIIRGSFFITSEQPPHGARKYSIRSFDEQGSVETVGNFCAFASKEDALAALVEVENAA